LTQDKHNLKVDWCSHEAAKYACLHWHYSKTIPTGKLSRLGVWENSNFIGTVFFGSGASAALGKPYGLKNNEVCELVRVALTSHQNFVSKIIAISIRKLKKANPGLNLIVSFADPFQGHCGGIYQAGNWIYNGDSSPSHMYLLSNGELAHPRRFSGSGWNAPKKIPLGAKKIKVPGKHRYLMPLNKKMRKQILPLSKPYPKRSKQAMDNTPVITAKGQNLSERSKVVA